MPVSRPYRSARVRSAIRKAVPGAREVISYMMPTYTLDGDRLLHFAVWKQHYSIYAATEQVVAAFQDELASYKVDKGSGYPPDFGTLANAAQLLGAGRALLEASARHARERIQFGQPVGSFQAVKHHLADMLIGLEFARPLLFGAAVALGSGAGHAARDVSAAKVACAGAAHRAARIALQVHGAIGYTAEHDAGLWLTKVQALGPAWGSPAWHRARLLAELTGQATCT